MMPGSDHLRDLDQRVRELEAENRELRLRVCRAENEREEARAAVVILSRQIERLGGDAMGGH